MAGTMLELWERYREARVGGGFDGPAAVALRAELVEALRITGPIYLRGVTMDPYVAPVSLAWVGLFRGDGQLLWMVKGDGVGDPLVAPGALLGDGTARDAACVMVPEAKVETWRDRPALL